MALKDLFKKKPGGTKVGNFLRGATQAVAGAIPGVGSMASKAVAGFQSSRMVKDSSDNSTKRREYIPPAGTRNAPADPGTGTGDPKEGFFTSIKNWLAKQKTWVKVAIFSSLGLFVIFIIYKKMSKKTSYNKRRRG